MYIASSVILYDIACLTIDVKDFIHTDLTVSKTFAELRILPCQLFFIILYFNKNIQSFKEVRSRTQKAMMKRCESKISYVDAQIFEVCSYVANFYIGC